MRVFPAIAVVTVDSEQLVDRIVVAPAALGAVARLLSCEPRKVNERVNRGLVLPDCFTFTGRAVRGEWSSGRVGACYRNGSGGAGNATSRYGFTASVELSGGGGVVGG